MNLTEENKKVETQKSNTFLTSEKDTQKSIRLNSIVTDYRGIKKQFQML